MTKLNAYEAAAALHMSLEEEKMRDPAEFERRVNSHDLTYGYSDDNRWYTAGSISHDWIRRAAKFHDIEWVKTIWNAKVDRTLVEGARETFYWR